MILVADNNEIEVGSNNNNITIEKMQKNDTTIDINDERQFNEHEKNADRTISSSSSEQLIPKEKQTGKRFYSFKLNISHVDCYVKRNFHLFLQEETLFFSGNMKRLKIVSLLIRKISSKCFSSSSSSTQNEYKSLS